MHRANLPISLYRYRGYLFVFGGAFGARTPFLVHDSHLGRRQPNDERESERRAQPSLRQHRHRPQPARKFVPPRWRATEARRWMPF